jgi:hypothetical protein
MNSIDLFYFNHSVINPIVFVICKIFSLEDEKIIEQYSTSLFQILIENNMAKDTDIFIFSIIKEHDRKMINWILPSKKSNKIVLQKIESNNTLLNTIISETLKNTNCETFITLSKQPSQLLITSNNMEESVDGEINFEINIKDCCVNLGFIVNEYF